MKNTCIIIAGPTAVGKTDLAVELAKHYSAEIISADSRQCFRELNIGVSKPSLQQLEEVHHYFINSHSIHDNVTAAVYEKYALESAAAAFEKSPVLIMVGGTGLYIKAFAEGLDAVPEPAPAVREIVMADFEAGGLALLQEQIRKEDPLFAKKGEMLNPRRVMRALEVKRTTGKSIVEMHTAPAKKRDFKIVRIALDMPREQLYNRIHLRTDQMMKAGLLEEVRGLTAHKHLPSLQTVGYRELFDHLDGKMDYYAAVEKIKQSTRHYAKRQITWFKNHPGYEFVPPELNAVLSVIKTVK